MPSIGSTFSIAVTAMRTQQEALDVTAHNIANANTEGYSRQRAVFSQRDPLRTPDGVFGTGVRTVNVQVVRDTWLDASYRREQGAAAEHETRSGLLARVETLLAEPSETGLSSSIDAYFSAWSEAATGPTSSVARMALRDAGSNLAGHLRSMAGELDRRRQETEERILQTVQRVNDISEEIAELNRRIVSDEAGGLTAGDLRDVRARAVDELSRLVPVQVTHRENGSIGVLVSGVSLVDGSATKALEVRNSGGTFSVGLEGHSGTLPDLSGQVGGLLTLLNVDLPDLRSRLDDLAEALVTEVNAIHQTGTNAAGATGVDFFDPAATTASSISLSAAVEADAQAIAVGTADALGNYRGGANDVALELAALRDEPVAALGATFGEHFRELASDVGLEVRASRDQARVHGTLADQAETRRSSYSGVSTDEELVNLIRFQSAYAAAARVITTADEVLESLLRM